MFVKGMHVRKIGHCCLVIDIRGNVIVTDPGVFSAGKVQETNICAVILTHEHADHLNMDALREILDRNPQAVVVTNEAVGELLRAEGIPYKKVEDGETEKVNGILIEGYGRVHAHIEDSIPPVANTGYFIDNAFYYPGDAFYNPGKSVEVLALPIQGLWMKSAEAVDFARLVKPAHCFPVSDGFIKPELVDLFHELPKNALEGEGVEFVPLKEGETHDF